MGKGSAPKAPKYGKLEKAMAKSASEATKIAKKQLAYQKEQFAFFKQQGIKSAELTDKVTGAFLEQQAFNFDNAQKDRERYETIFQPVEDHFTADAMAYDSPERRAEEMGKAQADVAMQWDKMRENAIRDMEGYGLSPSSTRFQAMDLGVRIEEAKAKAAAGNVAAWRTEDKGDAMQLQAINIGKGYPGQVIASGAAGAQLGSGAVSGQNATVGTMGQTQGTAPQYGAIGNSFMGTAQAGTLGQGQLMDQGFQNQNTAYNTEQAATTGWGDILGLAAGMGSKFLMAADGGPVNDPEATPGGAVPVSASPSGGSAIDDVDAKLTPGEYVIPKDVTEWLGKKHLQKLVEKSREEAAGPTDVKPTVAQGVTGPAQFVSRPQGAVG
jgi:hypothetical protein